LIQRAWIEPGTVFRFSGESIAGKRTGRRDEVNMMMLFLLLAMAGEPSPPCGCRDAGDVKTIWGHDHTVAVWKISCDKIGGDLHALNGKLNKAAYRRAFPTTKAVPRSVLTHATKQRRCP
jgi:hypothetical protein